MRLLRFSLDAHQYGIASDSVVEIVRAVAITPLPGAPSVVEGVIDVRGPVNEAQLADLERIRRNQRHLLNLVNDVLSFARLETGEISLNIGPVKLDATVRPLRAMIRPQAAKRAIEYQSVACGSDVVVTADGDRVEQILIDLLGNAIKGGAGIHVHPFPSAGTGGRLVRHCPS